MPKQKGIYAETLPVPAKKIAGGTPLGTPSLGNAVSPTVPEKAGQIHGLGPQGKPVHQHGVKGVHGFGHLPHQHSGHLRLSGATDAHRLGVRAKGPSSPKTGT